MGWIRCNLLLGEVSCILHAFSHLLLQHPHIHHDTVVAGPTKHPLVFPIDNIDFSSRKCHIVWCIFVIDLCIGMLRNGHPAQEENEEGGARPRDVEAVEETLARNTDTLYQ